MWERIRHGTGSHKKAFEQKFSGGQTHACPIYMRHKTFVADPETIRAVGIPVYRAEQGGEEFIITFPRGYHAGFNNLAEATNFATTSWISRRVGAKI